MEAANPVGNPNWQPGVSGNPAGNPKIKRFLAALERAITQGDGQKLRDAAEKLLEKAADGEPWAVQMLADRLDGKAVQSVEVSGDERRDLFDAALLGTALELLKRLPERVRQEHLVEADPVELPSNDSHSP